MNMVIDKCVAIDVLYANDKYVCDTVCRTAQFHK